MRVLAVAAVLFLVCVPAFGAMTVSGTINRTYPNDGCGNLSGCTCSSPTVTAGVRYATVQIRNTSNTVLATTSTDASGHYSVSVSSLNAGTQFLVVLWAETAAAQVADFSTGQLIGVQTVPQTSSTVNLLIDSSVDASVPNIRPALMLMDKVVVGYQYASNRGLSPSQVTVFMNANGTFYQSGNNALYVASSENWHDAVVHEYGHYVDDALSPFRGAAGLQNHFICGQYDSNPEGVFGEDWASYFMSVATGHTFFYQRWCSVESGPCSTKSQTVEGNAAAVLWDLNDSANESFDTISNEYQKVWNVMDGFELTNATLAEFMSDYNDSRADAIECQYTGVKCSASTHTLSVSKSGAGSGTVTSSPSGINCGSTCSASFTHNAQVTLTASASSGSTFGSWSGACSGTSTQCTVTMSQNQSVTATFNGGTSCTDAYEPNNSSSTGFGPISAGSTYNGKICDATDVDWFKLSLSAGQTIAINLTVPASNDYDIELYDTSGIFRKGSYNGTGGAERIDDTVPSGGTYYVRIYGYQGSFNTTSTYALSYTGGATTQTLSVSRGGSGSGSVTSNPAGINCGGTCSASFATNTQVTLTASAANGSSFTTWGGACSGSSTQCTVTMSQAQSVTANFDTVPQTLTVSKSGTGGGTVTSSPSGINCGATCQNSFAYNSQVTLTATPDGNSTFSGWSGACSGSQCTVTMSQAQNVTATFTANQPGPQTLNVNHSGTGSGNVTSSPAGINCGGTCSTTFTYNTVVTLTASPVSPSTFTGWSGEGCSGTGTCQVTMSQTRNVTATFTSGAANGASFYVIPACRLIDTRDAGAGAWGAPALTENKSRNFTAAGRCAIPSGVAALAVNVTAVGASSNGWLTLYAGPSTAALPAASTLNYATGKTLANNAVVQVGADGTINVYNSGPFTIHAIVDVYGYFQ